MFQVEQTYDLASLTALCRAMRKKVQKWRTAVRVVVWGIVAAGSAVFLLSLAYGRADWMLLLALAVLLLFLLFEDRLNGWVALRQLLPGTAHSTTVFEDDAYTVTMDTAETVYRYENITGLVETDRYFFFFLGKKHGEIFDKQGFQVGEPDAFRAFIEQKTGNAIQTVK